MKRVIVILMALLLLVSCNKREKQTGNNKQIKKNKIVNVQTKVAQKGEYVSKIKYYGTFSSLNKYDIKAEASGAILKIYKHEGDFVTPKTVLAKIDPFTANNMLRQAEGAYLSAKSAYELAKVKFSNDSSLYASKSISKLAFLQSQNSLSGAYAQYNQAYSNYLNAKRSVNRTTVRPLYSGVITTKYIKKGDLVNNGTPLFRINQMDKMLFSISVSQDIIKNLKKGMGVDSIMVGDDVFKGKIYALSSEADQQTSSYKVDIVVNNKKRKILDGFSGKAILKSEKFSNIFVLPIGAIVKKDGKEFVFVYKNSMSMLKEVKVLRYVDDVALLKSGINSGDEVIITNIESLKDSLKVKKQ